MKKNVLTGILTAAVTVSMTAAVLTGCGQAAQATVNSDAGAAGAEASEADVSDETADSTDTSTGATSGEVTTIKAVTGGNPRPYVYVDETDQPTGYDIEVLKVAFDLLPQYDLEIEVADFSAVFAGLNAGNYQIGVNNFSYNEERAENYLYSLPYDKVSYVFVYNKDAKPINSFDDVAGRSFEGGAGVSVTNAVEAWNAKNPGNEVSITYTEADMAVQLQHIEDGVTDFGIIDGPMYVAYIDEYGFDLAKSDIPEDEIQLIADNLYAYYLLPKDQEQLRGELDEAIEELKANGTLKTLSEQYFGGVDQSPEDEVLNAGPTN